LILQLHIPEGLQARFSQLRIAKGLGARPEVSGKLAEGMDARAAMGESINLRDETECAKLLSGFAVNASPKQMLAAARSARFHPLSGLSITRRVIQSGHARSALGMEKCSLARSPAIQRGRAVERSTSKKRSEHELAISSRERPSCSKSWPEAQKRRSRSRASAIQQHHAFPPRDFWGSQRDFTCTISASK